MRKSALLLALTAFVGAGATAAAESADPSRPKRICRAAQKSIGSHIRTPRRCRTEEQWRQEDEAAGRVPETLRVVAPKREGPQRPQ